MTVLAKILLMLCLAFTCLGNAIGSTLCAYLFNLNYSMEDNLTLSEQNFEEDSLGFSTFTIQYWNNTCNPTFEKATDDTYAFDLATYTGYRDSVGFHTEKLPSVKAFDEGCERLYENSQGEVHIGLITGGDYSTDYADYILSRDFSLDSNYFSHTDITKAPINSNIGFQTYSMRDSAKGKDYTLELYYTEDRTGCVYKFTVLDYTLTRELPIIVTFTNFSSGMSYPSNDDVLSYASADKENYLVTVDSYTGDWSSGVIIVDDVEYNLRADNLRVLESQNVLPYSTDVGTYGYETLMTGGVKDIDFVFGNRLITLTLETKQDEVLRNSKILGFSTNIDYNIMTSSDKADNLGLIEGNGTKVSESTFKIAYQGEVSIKSIKGVSHYYLDDGTEITREEYQQILAQRRNNSQTDTTDSNTETVSENNATTENTDTDSIDIDSIDTDSTDTDTDSTETDSTDTDSTDTDSTVSDNSVSENSVSDNSTTSDSIIISNSVEEKSNIAATGWLKVGGLSTQVQIASLEAYIKSYSTNYTMTGSGNEIVYTVEKGTSTMIFTLSNSEFITKISITY